MFILSFMFTSLACFVFKTPSEELNSLAGMILKRHMCLQLAQPETLYPNNKEKKTKILKKYRQFILPVMTLWCFVFFSFMLINYVSYIVTCCSRT